MSESTSLSYRRVAYGSVNEVYYSSFVSQRTGGDGVMLLEINEEDKIVGQAETNELDGFEENWKVNAEKHIPGWINGFNSQCLDITGLEAYGHLGWNNHED
uniref:Uncharacterized protein n=1 Tax=Tanacetum cinerariifolium TaxID=118510 RepID=A0A699H494_TANCI|nr:hypothetical protein [Tanacetum cinerariifolium]